ncbi:hypothetical protein PROFUN_14717 [Planoprotostelium fungivorum]|uniref:Rieske domain-containing protein n=1 Tax=Planoprotostelium fungivorum TaxID=1890364 RepID=A0A2P6MZ69_9EUKA|nr:hypothetical protein PROFUN_14717 [Planoprotostelium fungivorum]
MPHKEAETPTSDSPGVDIAVNNSDFGPHNRIEAMKSPVANTNKGSMLHEWIVFQTKTLQKVFEKLMNEGNTEAVQAVQNFQRTIERKAIELDERESTVRGKEQNWSETMSWLNKLQRQNSTTIRLNVGGTIFTTTVSTLTSQPNSRLCGLFSGTMELTKMDDGCYFFDRSPSLFSQILDWLRSGEIPHTKSTSHRRALLVEAEYYGLDRLVRVIDFDGTFRARRRLFCMHHTPQPELIGLLDISTMGLQSTPMMPNPKKNFSILSFKGQVFVSGGRDKNGATTSADVFDPNTNSWSQICPMNCERENHSSASYVNHIYVTGGRSNVSTGGKKVMAAVNEVERYNGSINTWEKVTPMISHRESHAMVQSGELLYSIGGMNSEGVALDTVEYYDIRDGQWHSVANMRETRYNHSAISHGEYIYVVGGVVDGVTSARATRYHTTKNHWETIPPMTSSRWGTHGMYIDDRWIYVCGGNEQTEATFERIDTEDVHSGWEARGKGQPKDLLILLRFGHEYEEHTQIAKTVGKDVILKHHMAVCVGKKSEFTERTYLTIHGTEESSSDNIAPPQETLELVLFKLDDDKFYCMETVCPHSGGNLAVVICPYHEFEFSLNDGNSTHGFKACTYDVTEDGDDISIHTGLRSDLKLIVEKRPVDMTTGRRRKKKANEDCKEIEREVERMGIQETPRTLVEWAVLVLNTSDPIQKVATSREAGKLWNEGKIDHVTGSIVNGCQARTLRNHLLCSSCLMIITLNVVPIGKEGKRGKGGTEASRIALLHSLANIEQWAIDLAWDIVARFAGTRTLGSDLPLPREFFTDFIKVALDESKHFTILNERMKALGSEFGALPVHNGLWESATTTSHDLLCRLAIVHMVHEARGLDVNPATIAKFERAKDEESVKTLKIIHDDEITHVGAGHKWFAWMCENSVPPIDKVEHFQALVRKYFRGPLKPPFNEEDRRKAGLSEEWYMPLTKK